MTKKTSIPALFKAAFSDWIQDNASRLAAALAYYALFSLAPLLLIAISVAGLVFGRDAAAGQVHAQLAGLIGQDGAAAVEAIVQNADKPAASIGGTLFGIFLLLFGASGVMGELKSALNTIWEVPPAPSSGLWDFVKQRFLSFTMVLAVGFLLLVSLVVSALLAAVGDMMAGWLPAPEPVMHAVNVVVSFVVITGLFMLIFRYVPDAKIAWRDVWLGAAVTAIFFTMGKYAIGLYLGKGGFATTYGAAASVVVFLVWVYYSAQILFFGAEFTQVYANMRGSRIVPEDRPARGPAAREERRRAARRVLIDRRQAAAATAPDSAHSSR